MKTARAIKKLILFLPIWKLPITFKTVSVL